MRVSFQNGALPYGLQYALGLFLPNAFDEVLYQLHVLAVSRKDGGELFFGRLKHAESCIEGTIDDLNVLNVATLRIRVRKLYRTDVELQQWYAGRLEAYAGRGSHVMMRIIPGDFIPADLGDPRVAGLLQIHLTSARGATAPGSAHALDIGGLQSPDISFWTIWDDDMLLGMGALKRLSADHGEIKSMHTVGSMTGLPYESHRRQGCG